MTKSQVTAPKPVINSSLSDKCFVFSTDLKSLPTRCQISCHGAENQIISEYTLQINTRGSFEVNWTKTKTYSDDTQKPQIWPIFCDLGVKNSTISE